MSGVDDLLLGEKGGRRGGGGAADAALKTKTPHVNVGKNDMIQGRSDLHPPKKRTQS